jgi:hypothetical protein
MRWHVYGGVPRWRGAGARPYLSPPACLVFAAWVSALMLDTRAGSGGGALGRGGGRCATAAAPPLSDRRESLLDSLKNKSHKYALSVGCL